MPQTGPVRSICRAGRVIFCMEVLLVSSSAPGRALRQNTPTTHISKESLPKGQDFQEAPRKGFGGGFCLEFTNSKHEIRNSKQYRMTKIQMTQTAHFNLPVHKHHGGRLFLSLRHSGFGFVSDFDIRISDLYRFSKINSEIRKGGISGCRKKRSNCGTFF